MDLTQSYSVADGRLPKGMTVSRACVADFMVEGGGAVRPRAADCRPVEIEFANRTHEGDEMKVAVITGAAQGIGRRTAEVLAEAGYALALLDLRSCEATLAAFVQRERMRRSFAGISRTKAW